MCFCFLFLFPSTPTSHTPRCPEPDVGAGFRRPASAGANDRAAVRADTATGSCPRGPGTSAASRTRDSRRRRSAVDVRTQRRSTAVCAARRPFASAPIGAPRPALRCSSTPRHTTQRVHKAAESR